MKEKSLPRKSTTIAIRKETRDKLVSIARKDQTFEQIIRELLSKWDFEK